MSTPNVGITNNPVLVTKGDPIRVEVRPNGRKGDPGEGVPAGGTTGQVLTKASATDYDTEWVDNDPDGVQSVTGDGVDNTDPANPVISWPDPSDIGAYPDTNPSNFVDANGAASAAPVQSVTGTLVGGTPSDPTIDTPTPADIGAESVWVVTTDNTGTLTGTNVLWLADTSAARNRTLDVNGERLQVKDVTGSAGANNITLTAGSGQTINGNATETIDIDFGWVEYVRSGTNWEPIAGNRYATIDRDDIRKRLFMNGESGVWYDINDLSTLFTDVAQTTPALVGDAVACVRDKSGNECHLFQETLASRPLLQVDGDGNYYLDFDGTNDIMSSYMALPAKGESRAFVCAGVQRDTRKVFGIILETSRISPNRSGSLLLIGNPAGEDTVFVGATGNSVAAYVTSNTFANPLRAVISCRYQIGMAIASVPQFRLRINDVDQAIVQAGGAASSYSTTPNVPAQFNAHIVNIGSRLDDINTLAFDGRIYQIVMRYGTISDNDLAFVESYVNARTTAY